MKILKSKDSLRLLWNKLKNKYKIKDKKGKREKIKVVKDKKYTKKMERSIYKFLSYTIYNIIKNVRLKKGLKNTQKKTE